MRGTTSSMGSGSRIGSARMVHQPR
jgi:hypothetical protein